MLFYHYLLNNVGGESFINSAIKRYPQIFRLHEIPLDDLLEGIDLLMNNTIFEFDSKYYHQIYGVPMGGPSSVTFADMVIKDFEVECLNSLDFKPLVCY